MTESHIVITDDVEWLLMATLSILKHFRDQYIQKHCIYQIQWKMQLRRTKNLLCELYVISTAVVKLKHSSNSVVVT